MWGGILIFKTSFLFAFGFFVLFSASLDCGYGLKCSQKAYLRMRLYFKYGSPLRQSSRIIIMIVGFKQTFENSLLRFVDTWKVLCFSLKPAIATCPNLVNASCMPCLIGFRYNLSNFSVRMFHSSNTDASVSQLDNIIKDSELVPAKIDLKSKALVLYSLNSQTSFNGKILNLFEDTGEACKISLNFNKKEQIMPAFTKAKSEYKRGPLNLINFKEIVSPENLCNAWVQLNIKSDIFNQDVINNTLKAFDNLWFEQMSQKLIKGLYKYPKKRRVKISKPTGLVGLKRFKISNIKIKIIEKALLNGIKPFFEGSWVWVKISQFKYENLKADYNFSNTNLRVNKFGFFF